VPDLTRFSVSLEADLLEGFDKFVRGGSLATRGEAIRQLPRQPLTKVVHTGELTPAEAADARRSHGHAHPHRH
jgi:CopG family nickel-responsive transcriptional regulator